MNDTRTQLYIKSERKFVGGLLNYTSHYKHHWARWIDET